MNRMHQHRGPGFHPDTRPGEGDLPEEDDQPGDRERRGGDGRIWRRGKGL